MKPRQAIVVGGSMGGLFAANLLLRAGWSVRVFEKSAVPLTSRGTGIVTNNGLRTLLAMAGANADNALGVDIERRVFLDGNGAIAARLHLPQALTAWSRLLGLLLRALPADCYALGRGVASVEPGDDARPARVLLEDGTGHEADLVVAADGVRSAIRRRLFDAPAPAYAGYVAWRALLLREALGAESRARLGEVFAMAQAPGEQIVGYPVLGEDDRVYINTVWYRDTPPARLAELLTDANGRHHPEGIPPGLIRPQWVQQARVDAGRVLHACWGELVGKSPELMVQIIVDSTVERMVRGRVALLGDAAFVARPHVGQGVTKAGGDALALVQALADPSLPVTEALERYSARRVPIGRFAVEKGRNMGAAVLHDPGERADWARHFKIGLHVLQESGVEIPGVANLPPPSPDQGKS